MKSNFYEKIISTEDKNKKLLLDKMSNLLDESIKECMDLRERQANEEKIKFIEKTSQKPKERRHLIRQRININYRIDHSQNNERIQRLRNLIHFFEEESESLNRLIENNNVETIG